MNDVVYKEGDLAKSVFIVYLGECVLLKNHKKLLPGEKKNMTKQCPILHLTKGGFTTFEATDPGVQTYQNSLVVRLIYLKQV